ncbi:deoxyribonuclease IV [bacterium]|nr:deoxyribonuclease IV [bacterium]
MSIQGGAHRAIERGVAAGCTALQLFTRNNLQWAAKPLDPAVVDKFRAAWAASDIGPIVAHANYLIDLGSADPRIAGLSLDGVVLDLERAAALGVPWVVLHPGFHLGDGEDVGLRRIANAARRALDRTDGLAAGILLENTAGQGTCLGHRFEHLAWLLDAIGVPERLGVCFDTCHAFAAGYDLSTRRAYRNVFREFDDVVGVSQIHAFHLNDAKGELGSHADRHDHLGKGNLGIEPFHCLMRDRRFARVPKLLETRKKDDERDDWDAVSLALLREWAETPLGRGAR